jgi:hypothetical protein
MSERSHHSRTGEQAGHLLGGIVALVIAGTLLGLGYNLLGMEARRPWGLTWIAEDKAAALAEMTPIVAVEPSTEQYYTNSSIPWPFHS